VNWGSATTEQSHDWKEEISDLIVIYRMLEHGDLIPVNTDRTDYSFIDGESGSLQRLFGRDLIRVDGHFWQPTAKAVELRNKMVAVYDQLLKFEIFGCVALSYGELPEDISDDGSSVFDHCYDPRFCEPDSEINTQDLRLTLIGFLYENMREHVDWCGDSVLSKHRMVFFQMLADGQFNGNDIWFYLKLGTIFDSIKEIVDTAYPWTALSDDEESSSSLMREIYTMGMLEQRKRDGFECSECGIPLGVFEMNEKEEGRVLTKCPNPDCGASFIPPEPEGDVYECPSCGSNIGTLDHQCHGCGAILDFSMKPGTVVSETVEEMAEEVEDAWGRGVYDYEPYGWYDPYDPFYDMVAFGLVCAVLW
jgi:hypothetical protein